jgi:ABC-type transport system involved in multi-copper enzyme maturation permease subunit
MMWFFFVRFAIPVLGVFYGTSLIADEVEDKTITYLFSRPVPRSAVLFGKYLAYLVCTVFVVLPAVVLVWLLVVPIGGSLGAGFGDLLKDLGLLALGLMVYGAVFALVGAALKRPLLSGLVFVLGWEPIAVVLPGYLKRLSVAYYLQGLVPHAMPANSPLSLIQELFREIPTLTESLFWLAVITAGCLWLAARAVTRREYVLEQ